MAQVADAGRRHTFRGTRTAAAAPAGRGAAPAHARRRCISSTASDLLQPRKARRRSGRSRGCCRATRRSAADVTGFADATGADARNIQLAKDRAKAVRAALVGTGRAARAGQPQGAGEGHRRRRPEGSAPRRSRRGRPRCGSARDEIAEADEHFALLHRPADLRVGRLDRHHARRRGGDVEPADRAVSGHHAGADHGVARPTRARRPTWSSNSVAAPIEQQINGADNMIYMESSSSSSGNHDDHRLLRDRHESRARAGRRAEPRQPRAAAAARSRCRRRASACRRSRRRFMMVIAMYSPDERYDASYIANYANLYVLDALKRIPGAGQTQHLRRARPTRCASG